MNKNRHRIIFNAARGQRMVVAESASGISGGGASGEGSSPGNAGVSLRDWDICKPGLLRNLAPPPLSLSIGLALTLGLVLITTAHAQVIADPTAPGNQRPTILQTANGLPLVNLQTPSAAGVSRNKFIQFDVQSNGVILNNSRTNTNTQLAGNISANPWLATGEARVILNEVRSLNPTYLNGYVEVAGRRAEVIIANPAGIQVNGGGFINASSVTLTTGTPVMNSGSLDSFRVGGGKVRIEGLGLDTSTADYTAILARAVEVNAGLWAKDLTVVTGTNEVKALASGAAAQATKIAGSGTEPTPNFMLDVAAIGGMYAGKIYLVGTEAGLGVNNRGSLIAQEGEWVLKADGSLINTGKVQAKGDLSIQTTGAVSNTGANALISSQGNASISTGDHLANTRQAEIAASGALSVNAVGSLDNTTGTVAADGAVQIIAAGIDNTQGMIASVQSTLNLDSGSQVLTNVQGTIAARQGATVDSGTLNNDKGLIQAGTTLFIDTHGQALTNTNATGHGSGAGGIVAGGAATLDAGNLNNTAGTLGSGGALLATTDQTDNTDGDILSAGTLGLTTTGPLTNVRGQLQAVGAATIDTRGAKLDNTAGRVSSQSTLALTTGELLNGALATQAGLIGSDGNLTLHAGALTNGAAGAARSNIWSAQTASVTATSFTNAGVLSGTHVTLGANTGVNNLSGSSIEADGNLTITAPTATLSNAGQLIANQTLDVKAKDISNTGRMEATDQTLEAKASFTNAAGASVTASNAIDIGAVTFNNRGLVNANEITGATGASQVHIHATTVNNTGTGAIFGDRIAIASTTLNNRPEAAGGTAPVIAAREQLDIGVLTLNNEDGALLYSGGSMAVGGGLDAALAATGQAQAVNNLSADIEAIDHLRIATQTLTNERRNVSVSQVQVVDETANLNMPGWWVNGKNQHGKPVEATSNYTPNQYYLLDPTSILSDRMLVTPDGNVVREITVSLDPADSIYHAASGAYAGQYGVRERIIVGAPTTTTLYARVRQDGVSNPDQVAGSPSVFTADMANVTTWQNDTLNYSNAYGRCTTDCTLLVVEPGYSDPQGTILRASQRALYADHPGMEVSRMAHHTAVEDRLNAGAGAAAAIRSGGGMQLNIGSSLTNSFSDIQAGGVLDTQAASATVSNVGQTLKRSHSFQNTSQTAGGDSFDWTAPDITEVIGQVASNFSGAQQLNITAKNLTNTDLARSTGLPTSGLGFLGVTLPTANAPITLPRSALFRPASPSSGYLVESDPRFTNGHQWLGSAYQLSHLTNIPATTQKLLGDGMYEQGLIREQVAQLTGRRFLDGYANDEAQFRALMDSGVVYAQQWQLIPGVALTAEQMARLTTDLVWLVEREVVLADGTRTKALVPQLYVRQVPEGDFQASGALLAGDRVSLQIEEDLVNAGGRIEGGVVVADAGRDLNNIGGLMQARSELLAKAGRHVTISSPTHTTTFAGQYVDQSRTELAAIGEMKVGNAPGAKLSIEADGNVTLQGASVSNASTGGTTTIRADGNVELKTVEVGNSDNTEYNAKNYQRHSQSQEVGTSVAALGDITISAGDSVVARAASVQALGDLSVSAVNDIVLEAGHQTSESATSVHTQRKGPLSKKSFEEAQSASSDVALGSSFSGANVVMEADRDIQIKGSSVNAQDLLLLDAQRDVLITSEQNTESESQFSETKQSGFNVSKQGVNHGKSAKNGSGSTSSTTQAGSSVSGGDVLIVSGRDIGISASTVVADDLLSIDAGRHVSIVAGIDTHTSEQASSSKSKGVNVIASGMSESITLAHDNRDNGNGTSASTTATSSTVGSLGGNVTITAGQKYQQTGSDVLALQGDIDIEAQSVEITEARETRSHSSQQNSKSTVLGATPRNALVDLIKSAKTTAETAQAISDTGNSRVQALGAAATALNAYNTANQAAALMADPSKIASVTIDFNLGSNKSHSESTETVESGRGSTVAGAGNVRITAKGTGADSDILIRGSDVSAGNDALLKAEGDVRLESSQDEMQTHSTNQSSGASIGVGVSLGASNGITFNASANKGEGETDGQDVTQRNTHIVAGHTARIESGANTTLAGASVNAETVQAEVGGDLNIESRQDTSTFKSDQQSSGWGVSLCIPPFCYGASSVSASSAAQKIESEFASVAEQSGFRAGDGGFQVNVGKDTTLKGGAITSMDKAVQDDKNRFATAGELTTSDVENHASYTAEGYSVTATVSGKLGDQDSAAAREGMSDQEKAAADASTAPASGSAGIGEDSGEARSTTQAAISGIGGNTAARTGEAEAGIAPIFDNERVQREIDAQIKITAEFGKNASKAIGDYATKKYSELRDTDPEEAAKWDEGGIYRSLAHAVVGGLTGGAAGAAGAGLAALSAEAINQLTEDMPDGVRNLVGVGIAAGIGAIAGGSAGAATAFNADVNNRQLHPNERALAKRLAQKSGGKYTAEEIENALRTAGNNKTGESVVAGMVVDPSLRDAIYDKGAVWTTGADGWLVQVLPPQPDADLSAFIKQNTGETYGWYTPSSGGMPSNSNAPRDRLTGQPLDEKGRYSQTVVLDGKAYEPKYHPCATAECIRTGVNLDMSDPDTQAYVKALDAQVFKGIGRGATLGIVAFSTGVVAATLGGVGLIASAGEAFTGSTLTDQSLNELSQRGGQWFFENVLRYPPAAATRSVAMIALAGGWDSFVARLKTDLFGVEN